MNHTTSNIVIVNTGDHCQVKTPMHPDWVDAARKRRGRWQAPYWVFDARDEAGLRAAAKEIFGTDGTDVPCVDVRIDVDTWSGYVNEKRPSGPMWCGLGRILVERKGRDYRVKLGDGVVVIEGGFPDCGGSVKNPRPDPDSGTVLEVRDVPIELARRWVADHPGITIIESATVAEPAIVEPVVVNPLASFIDADLIDEIKRRGYQVVAVIGGA